MFRPLFAHVTFTHPASPDDVWAAFTNAPRWPEVLPGLESARIDPDGTLTPGATIETVARADGFSARTVYEFKPADTGAGTTLTVAAQVKPERLGLKITSQLWPHKYNEHIERSIRRRTTALLDLAGNGGMDV